MNTYIAPSICIVRNTCSGEKDSTNSLFCCSIQRGSLQSRASTGLGVSRPGLWAELRHEELQKHSFLLASLLHFWSLVSVFGLALRFYNDPLPEFRAQSMSIFTIGYSGADLGSCVSGRRTKGGKPTSRPWAASKQGLRPCCVDHWFPYPESTSSSSPREMTLLHSRCLWSEYSCPSSFNTGEKPRLKPTSPSSWPQ